MKAAEPKSAATPAKKNSTFFSKESGQDFFGSSEREKPFFSNPQNNFSAIQTKLTIGQPNDKYEQEADAMAEKVVQRLSTQDVLTKNEPTVQTKPLASVITPLVQTKCTACEQEEKLQKKEEEDLVQESPLELQRKPIFESNAESPDDKHNIQRKCAECEKEEKLQRKPDPTNSTTASSDIEGNINSSKGGGSPIPSAAKEQMEHSFGTDFSNVRLHTDSSAVQMNKDLNAQAFTHGSDIYFNSGKYDPGSKSGKHLLAHELTHTLQQKKTSGNVIQNKDIRTICNPAGKDKPETIPNAANILVQRYSHLARVITGPQLEQIQNVLDAQEKVTEYIEKQKPFKDRIHWGYGGRGGDSYDLFKYDNYEDKMSNQLSIIARNKVFFVDSKLLAADDILDSGVDWSPPIQAFHEQMYKRFIEGPVRIEVHSCLASDDRFGQFLNFSWQAYPGIYWEITHDNGLIRFRSLMQAETLNYDYQRVLYGEQVKILGKMLELRREMGDFYPEAVGKQIGILDEGLIWDSDVKVGSEIGDIRGYYNDGRGRMEMLNALYNPQLSKTARIVLRSKENWLHIFATNPNFDTTEMDDPIGERGWLFILTKTKSPDIEIYEEFITMDGRELKPAETTWSGPGWRTERELSEFEEFAIGAIFGDAFESNSGSAMFGQILMSMIPIVGQIADARDVAVGIHKIYTTGGKDGKLQTAFALVGFVPFLGDYLKHEAKVAKNAEPAVQAAAKTDAVLKAVDEIGDGVSHQSAKKIEGSVEKGGKQGAEEALGSLPGVKKEFVKNVMGEARKVADNIAPGLKQADEVTGEASSAFGRQLPDLENPKLVAQGTFKIGEEIHFVKLVQIGNWKQLWICSKCGSLIAKIDEALIGASGAVADRLKRLRNSAADLERKVNAGKVKPTDVDKKVGKISYELNEMARKNPNLAGLAKVLHEDLEREYLKLYKVSSVNELTPGARAALANNFRPTPPGYHWRLADDGTLQVVRNHGSEGLSKMKYDKKTHRFFFDDAVKESKKFEREMTPAEAFAELGGADLKSPFGAFVDVLGKELGIPAQKLIDDLGLQNTKGFKDALQDTVRHRLKEAYVDMLYARITDAAHLIKSDTYKHVLGSTGDANKALRAASHEELMKVSRQLGSADKGSLGERWFLEWFAGRGEHIKTQAKLGPEHGIIHEATRKIDIYEDHLAREVKNVTTNLGTDGTKQVEDLLAGVGKDVKVGGVVTGYDSVRLVFIDPIGGAANAKWMVENLKKFKGSSLSFQIMNKEGVPLVIRADDLAKHGEVGLESIILNWTKVQPKLISGGSNDKYEQEANAMADKVVQRLVTPEVLAKNEPAVLAKPLAGTITPLIQTKCTACEQQEKLQKKEGEDLVQGSPLELQRKPIFESNAESPDDKHNIQKKCAECEKEEKLQRKPDPSDSATASSHIESNLNSSKGGGSTIPSAAKEQMENSFGADFSSVRLHTDSSAVQMSKDLNAQAFTHGSDIYSNSGKYDANSREGKHLLAHELTHSIQQRGADIKKFGFGEHMELGNEATKSDTGKPRMVQLADDYSIPFGEVVAMAGDHFESIDQMREFAGKNGKGAGTREEIEYVRYDKIQKSIDKAKGIDLTKTSFSKEAMESADKRYYKLALKNRSHFLNPTLNDLSKSIGEKGSDFTKVLQSLKTALVPQNANAGYRLNHFRAIAEAYMAGQANESIDKAMATEAFANHYLTDSFSAGHVTTARYDIVAYWNKLIPMFGENLKGYMAEKIAYEFNSISLKGWVSSVDLINDTSGWTWTQLVPEKGTYATVSDLIESKVALTFGDIVSLAFHDYYNKVGMFVYINGEKKHILGDGSLKGRTDEITKKIIANEGWDYISDAINLSVQDITMAWNDGRNHQVPLDVFASLLRDGAFESEKLIPVPTPDSELSADEKPVNWKYKDYKDLLSDTKFIEALKVFVASQASEFQNATNELGDEDKKKAFENAIIKKMKEDPAKVIREIIEWSPDTGGGTFGRKEDDNALAYANKVKKQGALEKLMLPQRIRLVNQLVSGVWAAGDEEEMIVRIFETAPPSNRLKIYEAVEGHKWNGDFVEGWSVSDDVLWNAIDDDNSLKRLRKSINEGFKR